MHECYHEAELVNAQFARSPAKLIIPFTLPSVSRQTRSLSESLSRQAPIGILQLGLDGGITRANPAFCMLIGYTEAQLRRLDNRAISYPEDFAAEVRLLQQMFDCGQSQQVLQKRYRCCDGRTVWAEVKLSLVDDPETDDEVILIFVTNVTDRRLIKQEAQQCQDRESLLTDLFEQMQTTFDQQTMQAVVAQLRQTLAVDRVLTYQIFPDNSGICMAEAVAEQYPVMQGQSFSPECVPPPYLEAYRDGRLWVVTDILDEDLADCHKTMLEAFDVRSMMIMAIVSMDAALEPQKRTLWGLLAVHCRTSRIWTAGEQRLLRLIAIQLATVIEHTQLLQSLQQRAQELEDRVSERTKSLAQALKFEQLVHQLTETLRQHLDADQVLQAAVEGLRQALNVERCFASLVEPDLDCLTIHYESVKEDIAAQLPLLQGQSFSLQNLSACYQDLKQPDRPQRLPCQQPHSRAAFEQPQTACIITSTDQLTADQLTADQLTADQLTANGRTADGWTADQLTADGRTADVTQLLSAACSTVQCLSEMIKDCWGC